MLGNIGLNQNLKLSLVICSPGDIMVSLNHLIVQIWVWRRLWWNTVLFQVGKMLEARNILYETSFLDLYTIVNIAFPSMPIW